MSASPDTLVGAGNATVNVVQEASSLLQTNGGRSLVAVLAVLAVGTFVNHVLSPSIDGQEPPVLKPTIPWIGHIITMIREGNAFLTKLSKHKMPIASVPMLNGKIYAVWDPALIAAVQRNRNLSFVPFVKEFGRRELAYDDATDRLVRETNLVEEIFEAIHEGMGAKNTNRMNAAALRYVATELSGVCPGGEGGDELIVDNIFLWTRDLMTRATCRALYGSRDPIGVSQKLMDDLWVFEGQLTQLLIDVFPSIIAPKGYQARKDIQAALSVYYGAGGFEDDDASGIARCRANAFRKFGVPASYIGTLEIALLHVSTANTIPTLFWFFAHVVTRPELVARIREEAEAMVNRQEGQDELTIHVDELADKCPLLVSCYREAIRLGNKAVGNRRVIEDTTISDGKGRSYLLKAGVDVMMPSEPLHRSDDVWAASGDGSIPRATEFDSERFLDIEKNKTKRASYVPFGGGRHLCPGRNFAFAENLGFMASLLLGFDVTPTDGDWTQFKPPVMDRCTVSGAVSKPVNDGKGFGMRVTRREGWQGVRWKFTSGGEE